MLINYLRTAWRRLWKNKGFFALNFMGLYISVTASLLIALLIIYEMSFDKGSRADLQVYRVVDAAATEHGKAFDAVTPYPLAPALRMASRSMTSPPGPAWKSSMVMTVAACAIATV